MCECGSLAQMRKRLGTGSVTYIFKIEMWKHFNGIRDHFIVRHCELKKEFGDETDYVERLAKADGFNSTEEFFNFFDKNYDLTIPKPFFVYRGGWDK